MAGVPHHNIRDVARIERQYLRQRTVVDRFGDRLAQFAGSIHFFGFQVTWMTAWIAYNGFAPAFGWKPFDPFPFVLLTMCVSIEAIFLTTVVLMSQNRQRHQADRRSHLDLQVNVLAEQEATKMLQMLQAICHHMGLREAADDRELTDMIKMTRIHELVMKLEEEMEPGR